METTQSSLAILNIGEHGESLVGNLAGYALLREAIERLEAQGSSREDVYGQMEIRTLELWFSEKSDAPSAAPSPWPLFLFLLILVTILGLAGFGLIQLTNLILN